MSLTYIPRVPLVFFFEKVQVSGPRLDQDLSDGCEQTFSCFAHTPSLSTWGYTRISEKNMETAIVCVYIYIHIHWGYTGIMEIETTILHT